MNLRGLDTSGSDRLKRRYPYPDDPSSLPLQRSLRFDELLGKFGKEPHSLSEHELNELVCECMFHGDVEALRKILAAQLLQTLDIPRQADERALWTLLSALPESCSIDRLLLRENHFDHVTGALLLEVMGRTQLKSLSLHSCNWNVRPGELTCPGLPNLRELHVEGTGNPMSLLNVILYGSQVSKFYFASNPGMTDEDHCSLANLLDTQCKAKLRDLTLRDLQAHDQTLDGLFKHYVAFLEEKTTTLAYLDLSGNTLSAHTCAALADALQDMTLHGLTLAGCWPKDYFVFGCSAVARLVGLKSLVKLDLSHNHFPYAQKSTFTELMWCKKLQYLDLHGAVIEESNLAGLAYSLGKLKPRSLCLPRLPDHLYARFLNAASESLLFLRVDETDQLHAQMPEEFSWLYPKYLALRACVDDNWRKWNGAVPLVEEGMKVLLSQLGGVDPSAVPFDIARRAAELAVGMNGAETESVSLVNKSARRKISAPETNLPVDKN